MTVHVFSRFTPLLALLTGSAGAATSATLPDWACTQPDTIYASAFDASVAPIPHDPTFGSGGAYPGSQTRTLHLAGLGTGTQNYYVYVPDDYTPERPWPLMLALHGVAPYGSGDAYAAAIRDNWITVANAGGFIIAAPVADDVIPQNGNPYALSWLVPPTTGPNDYDLFAAVRADMESAYNIERTRIYGWGFSAGGHVMHDLGVSQHSSAFNASTMAAYGVSGADLAAVACYGLSDAACNNLLAQLPRKIPLDIHIGNSDPNYPYAQSDHLRFVAEGWVSHVTIFYAVFVGGHTYTIDQLDETWTHLCPNAVTP
jgi:poly(3-hydroxybutyrate) depolymerase